MKEVGGTMTDTEDTGDDKTRTKPPNRISNAVRGALINFARVVEPFDYVAPLLVKNGYRPLPLPFGQKGPKLPDWQHYEFAAGDEHRYAGAGTGLICGELVVVDSDVYNPALADQIASLAEEMLGDAPTRVGLAPKSAMLYRVEGEPFKKLTTHAYRLPGEDPQSKPHRVEILAEGQQLVAFNTHPDTGKAYRWIGGRSPLTVPFSRLRAVSLPQVQEFRREADSVLAAHGTRIGKFEQAELDQEHVSNTALRAVDPDELRDALQHIPNDDEDYDSWIRMVYAGKGALGEGGRDDLMRWSAKSSKDVPKTTAKAWNDAKPDRIGAGTIFFHARRNGWQPKPGSQRTRPWPEPLADAAFQGLIGDIARAIEPESESDVAAIISQTLVAFGALVGRGPHVLVENDQHHANLFSVLVGATSKARKGTAWGRVLEIFSQVFGWPGTVTGLSSGEGLKYHVRDPVFKTFVNQKTFEAKEVRTDRGVEDKRLLVIEPEFSQVLRQADRSGNVLSAVIRSAWDTGDLQTLTRHDPLKATGAHISIVGDVTTDELRAEMTATEQANGFANRFLFMCVKRSKQLPRGGKPLDSAVRDALVARVLKAIAQARSLQVVDRTESAFELWDQVYSELSEGSTGLAGAVTARAEAQVLRLSLIYALADGSRVIDRCHLEAALAVWDRAEASAHYIFGTALGNTTADDILRALKSAGAAGLTRTQIRDLFARHRKLQQVGAALELLASKKLAVMSQELSDGGRPAEVWRATEHATEATKATEVGKSGGLSSLRSLRSQPRKVIRVVKRSDK